MYKKHGKKILASVLSAALILSGGADIQSAQAAKIKLNKTKATIKVGKTLQLKLKGASAKKVTWKSSKPKVATVNAKGKVKAKKAGTTKITAKYAKKKYVCKVTVKKKASTTTTTKAPTSTQAVTPVASNPAGTTNAPLGTTNPTAGATDSTSSSAVPTDQVTGTPGQQPSGAPAQPDRSGAPVQTEAAAGETTFAPSDESAAPADESAAPADESAAPADESAAPADESAAPVDESASPADESAAPVDESEAPSSESAAPSDESANPATSPAVESAAPSDESANPATSPAVDESAAPSDESANPATSPAVDGSASPATTPAVVATPFVDPFPDVTIEPVDLKANVVATLPAVYSFVTSKVDGVNTTGHVLIEVTNHNEGEDEWIDEVDLSYKLVDKDGSVLVEDDAELLYLAPGETRQYTVDLEGDVTTIDRDQSVITFIISEADHFGIYEDVSEKVLVNEEIAGFSGEFEPGTGNTEISLLNNNIFDNPLDLTYVCTLKDDDDKVVDVEVVGLQLLSGGEETIPVNSPLETITSESGEDDDIVPLATKYEVKVIANIFTEAEYEDVIAKDISIDKTKWEIIPGGFVKTEVTNNSKYWADEVSISGTFTNAEGTVVEAYAETGSIAPGESLPVLLELNGDISKDDTGAFEVTDVKYNDQKTYTNATEYWKSMLTIAEELVSFEEEVEAEPTDEEAVPEEGEDSGEGTEDEVVPADVYNITLTNTYRKDLEVNLIIYCLDEDGNTIKAEYHPAMTIIAGDSSDEFTFDKYFDVDGESKQISSFDYDISAHIVE